ncbi:hypothetical protein [Saccharicrinis aurantiacus]|uniref:hypothetical protein n=1 Tax=Saccharicrinis aurantiacus TaxID=1849719 RepID=UPI002493293F|nr:hypothetical protein [Saccharicrinis aurantiacus]
MAGEYASQLIKHNGDWHAAAMNFNFTSAIPGGNLLGKGVNVAAGTFIENSNMNKGITYYDINIASYIGRSNAGAYIQIGANLFGTIGEILRCQIEIRY